MSAQLPDDEFPTTQRRIRHITSLQIRNLTPFPARDALAQTLTQPGPSSSSLSTQPAADDIDLTLAARRRRRVSAGSISTTFGEAEDEGGTGPTSTKGQARSISKGSLRGIRNVGSGSAASTIRPRVRTSSKASSDHVPPASPSAEPSSPNEGGSSPLGGHFITHSQRALEKIVSSRLVETFVTLTLPPSPESTSQTSSRPSSPSMSPPAAASSFIRKGKDVSVKRAISAVVANHRRGGSTSSLASTASAASSSRLNRSHSATVSPPVPRTKSGSSSSRTSASVSKAANIPSPPPTPPPRSSPRPTSAPSTSAGRSFLTPKHQPENGQSEHSPPLSLTTPFYISPPHLPSTNPCFSHLDPEREFAPWADLSGSRIKVAIWGNPAARGKDAKGKGKEIPFAEAHEAALDGPQWKALEEWVVDLDDMEPLSPDVAAHHLPSNTLLVTVSSGETFRIPPVSSLSQPSSLSRASTPLGPEYNSDGEVDELRRRRWERAERDGQKREREALEKSRRQTKMKRTACWQDLVKIVHLQACLVDTQESLEEVVRQCDMLVEGDGYNASLRERSEREEWVHNLRGEREQVLQTSVEIKGAIETRRNALRLRRDTLAAARALLEKDLLELAAQAEKVTSERQGYETLVSSLPALRTSIIQTVSIIFPIEPLSAPDLLFTILGAPLPIPASGSDPAPPLLLPSHPEVTDDTTATALGYVAQVVQLISAYLGKGLVYPVTCCGSRSAIKDPISAMMGPRMFPLYSKGVETYRFEYGVFLLNKDLEMLMTDRNLRAMDMRHTLPNLKNLLLTLTTGEEAEQTPASPSPFTAALTSGLRSPTRAISPLALNASSHLDSQNQANTQSAIITGPRKATPFLSPLAAILRSRYPSSAGRPTVRVVDETPEPTAADEGTGSVETGREPSNDAASEVLPASTAEEAKLTIKANGTPRTPSSINGNASPFEKLANADEPPTPPPPLPGVT